MLITHSLLFSFDAISQVPLEVFSRSGVLVLKQKAVKGFNTFNLTNHSRGFYTINIIRDNKTIASQKIIRK